MKTYHSLSLATKKTVSCYGCLFCFTKAVIKGQFEMNFAELLALAFGEFRNTGSANQKQAQKETQA